MRDLRIWAPAVKEGKLLLQHNLKSKIVEGFSGSISDLFVIFPKV